MNARSGRPHVRFGVFEIDPQSGELWRDGLHIRLHDKPFQLLQALVEKRGEIVTRSELQKHLWSDGTFVEFENGLNNAMSRLRESLGDSADNPRFIQTVPRRGYRFIAPVEVVEPLEPERSPASSPAWRRPLAATIAIAAFTLAVMLYVGVAARSESPVNSVAVLPFVVPASGDEPLDGYVAFGMTEALIAELSRLRGIDVISQTSVLRYRNSDKSLREIARELGVGTIVEGSVLREGTQVRTTVQLIDARSNTHRWTRIFRHDAASVLTGQGDLARSIAQRIRSDLTGQPQAAVAGRTGDHRAEESFLKGRYFLGRGNEKEWARARTYFEEALVADPRHARAQAGLADYYILTDSMPHAEAYPLAKAHAVRALELDSSLADAHTSLGYLFHYFEWNAPAAEQAFRRALALDHNHSRALSWYSRFLGHMGRHAEAAEQVQKAIRLDPLSTSTRDSAASAWFHSRQYDRMIEEAKNIRELDPLDPRAYEHLTIAYLFSGRSAEATLALQQGLALAPESTLFAILNAILHARTGRAREASEMLQRIEKIALETHIPPVFLAVACAQLNRAEEAMQWLETGLRTRDPYMMILNSSPWFDPLRSDERFQTLLRQVGISSSI